MFEILVSHWAFYFACGHDADRTPYGSKDILEALKIIEASHQQHYTLTGARFDRDATSVESKDLDKATKEALTALIQQRVDNRSIAEHVFRVVVLALQRLRFLLGLVVQTVELCRVHDGDRVLRLQDLARVLRWRARSGLEIPQLELELLVVVHGDGVRKAKDDVRG